MWKVIVRSCGVLVTCSEKMIIRLLREHGGGASRRPRLLEEDDKEAEYCREMVRYNGRNCIIGRNNYRRLADKINP